ncbi:protein abnormal spindle [Coccinella septempunctata]|uniref:protein abnormal spindle n=1 Tax=Coccinella septempunctata TaxID=41139 RepID=UPI001D0768AC|nr:protein abnormal spindle [Coccinella septempunctata]
MYFQVSPAQSKHKPSKAANPQEDDIPTLTLAPFTQIPKLAFQDVAVNSLHEIKLYVTNKKPVPVFVNASFDGPEELEFSQSWCELRIDTNDTKLLEMYWYPNTEYCERHNLKVTCMKQMWNVPITFKSILPKKSKKKLSTTLVKKTSPLLRKKVNKTSQKLSTASSKVPPKKQPVWNDKPYVAKKSSRDKENCDINMRRENFRSSSDISFHLSSPDDIRRFTYAVNKLGFRTEGSPNLDDSLEMIEDLPNRGVLKGIQLNTLDEFLNKKIGLDSISYLGTPISQFFKPSRVSSELHKKDQVDKNVVENPKVIRNLSFEMNCEVQPSLNISSETRIIGNLSSDSLHTGLNGNTFVKSNISTGTFIKDSNSFEIDRGRFSLDLSDKLPTQSSISKHKIMQTHNKLRRSSSEYNMPITKNPKDKPSFHLRDESEFAWQEYQNQPQQYNDDHIRKLIRDNIPQQNCLSEAYCSHLSIRSGTLAEQENSFQMKGFDQSSGSFIEQLKQLEERDLSTATYFKDEGSFKYYQEASNYANTAVKVPNSYESREYSRLCTGYETSPKNCLRESTGSEISSNYSKMSPKKGMEVFPTKEILPTVKHNDSHNLFPIKEEPTDESLRRTQIKRKSDTTFGLSPLKRQNLSPETWSKVGGVYKTRMSVQRVTKLVTPKQNAKKRNQKENSSIVGTKGISYIEKKTVTITDPFILAATTAVDPFLTNTIYLDQDWIQRQEDRFKNWLNMLLTPPTDLNVSDEGQPIDAAKLWRECSQKEVSAAPTKEEVSSKYHTSAKLEALRRSAHELYNSDIIQSILVRVYDAIEKKKIEIRQDRNVHLDLSLQSKVMTLLLSYNPLWLRIALETIYREKLKLISNSDMLGLSKFLYERFFKDRLLLRKHKTVHNPKYNVDIKKFMLKRFFSIVYFLDKAKMNTLIPHDPCLFRKNSTVKESREMLIHFTRDAITAAVGDITKYLKYFGYVVEHKQDYIHEFDYAVNSLGGDLRDGVRLTRVMELILLRNDLTKNLRVPAISRLQKIYNVKLVFDSLAEAGYKIQHDIEPHHIVEGHREKTLSFLWQIIYKFQAPLVIETAKNIQKWWRSFPVCIKRMKLRKLYQTKLEASTKIQRWYRHLKQAEELTKIAHLFKEYMEERRKVKAAIKIQSYYRMYIQHKNYINTKNTIIKLQKQCRLWLQNVCYRQREQAAIVIQKNIKGYLTRNRFLQMKHSVLVIEKYVLARQLMLVQYQHFMQIKTSIIVIQRWYRATALMKKTRTEYLKWRTAVCLVQEKYRSMLMMRRALNEYNSVKSSTILIQKWYRSTMQMRALRNNFLNIKKSVITIEKYYIALKKMRIAKTEYHQLRCSTIVIQRYFRATLAMRRERGYYLSLKNSVDFVKSKYKANKMMLRERGNFRTLKKATIFLQRKIRANKLMQTQRKSYSELRQSTIIIQHFFRGFLLMKKEKKHYMDLKTSAVIIQQRYRAYKQMCSTKKEFETLKKVVIFVQTRFRANNSMKKQRQAFLREKKSCVAIQRYFRGFCVMRKERQTYVQLRSVVCFVQQKYRAKLAMKKCQEEYSKLKTACILLQRRYRAKKLMEIQKADYDKLKQAVNFVKSTFIAHKKMLEKRDNYQKLRKYTVLVQRLYRARKMMRAQRCSYLELRNNTIKIQKFFRGFLSMKKEKQLFLTLRLNVIKIQHRFRAQRKMIQTREYYRKLKHAVLFTQRKFRANKLMKKEKDLYILKRNASITIQRYWRGYLLMKKDKQNYMKLRKSVITIQKRYIAYKKMCTTRSHFERLRKSVVIIQTRYRSNKLMVEQRRMYLEQRRCCILIQKYYRSYLLMRKDRQNYLSLKATVRFVQEQYRAKIALRISRQNYLSLRQNVLFVQRTFRANQAMKSQRVLFLKKKEAVIKIQKYFRGYQQMKKDRQYFLSLTSFVFSIQRYARGFLIRKKYAHLLTPEAREERRIKKLQEEAATRIQARWRGYRQRKVCNNALKEIRKRSEVATRDADPQESLGSRSNRALEVLVTEEITVPLIISALTDFEYVTRRSPEICIKMGPLLPEQLYLLIKSVARSLPDIQICEISAYILINLCKYEQTTSMTWYPEYLDSMLKIMTHWCDKENMAFPSLCTLFWLFAHNKEYKKTILELPNIDQRIEKIHTLVLRKQKMVLKSESRMVISRFVSKKPLYLPGLKPDWGFDYPTRPRVFLNSVQAIECLIKILKSS